MLENDIHVQSLLNRLNLGNYNRYKIVRLFFQVVTLFTSLLFLGFLAVSPLDILAHAAKSQQFLEFFITIGGIVSIFILNLYWFFYRYFSLKQILKYNPKMYIPIFTQSNVSNEEASKKDKYKFLLINPNLYNLTLENFDLMPKLQHYFNYNKNKLVFNKGISPPKKTFDNFKLYNNYNNLDDSEIDIEKKNIQDMLPYLTNYSSVIEAFSQDLKLFTLAGQNPQFWKMKELNEMNMFDKTGLTYLEYLRLLSFECKQYNIDTHNFDFKAFIKLYNTLKFGNRTSALTNITESDFVKFMRMVIDFYKIKQNLDEAKYNKLRNVGDYQYIYRNKESLLQEDIFLLAQTNKPNNNRNSVRDGSAGYDYFNNQDTNSSDNSPVFDFEYSDDNDDSDDLEQINNIRTLSMHRNVNSEAEKKPKLEARLSDIKLQPIKKRKV
ncbi:uncharacterized protein HGUI_01589 [Hanseniaspora guilliermondii]|uniref:Defect at low temperature protein 1 n=1 Tax=Hanseniaspora guilliermondii TaxID=56406 RepID=A0A1L0CKL8_9ASCO|nr:uncharacterized protein HGUI_01589 [Hanseniaspora guilliermondii]